MQWLYTATYAMQANCPGDEQRASHCPLGNPRHPWRLQMLSEDVQSLGGVVQEFGIVVVVVVEVVAGA